MRLFRRFSDLPLLLCLGGFAVAQIVAQIVAQPVAQPVAQTGTQSAAPSATTAPTTLPTTLPTTAPQPTIAERIAAGATKIDLNTATPEQLKALPGIGDAYLKRIVDGRPYTAKNQLTTRGILPQAAYDRIKEQIIAHRPKKAEASAKAQP